MFCLIDKVQGRSAQGKRPCCAPSPLCDIRQAALCFRFPICNLGWCSPPSWGCTGMWHHIWLSRAFSPYGKSFLNCSVWLIRFYIPPNIFKSDVSLCPAAVPGPSSFLRQLGLFLPWDAEISHHTQHFDVALAQGGCSPPAMRRSEMPSPGRVRADSTALVLPPLRFSLPVAIIARQHRLTIAQANPWNKWIQGQGPTSVELCHWL